MDVATRSTHIVSIILCLHHVVQGVLVPQVELLEPPVAGGELCI